MFDLISEIRDKEKWESFIARHSPQSFFQSWNWGIVSERIHSKNRENILYRSGFFRRKKLEGIAQILKISAKRGSYLHVRHGPVFTDWTNDNISGFTGYIRNLCRIHHCDFVRISPLIPKTGESEIKFEKFRFRHAPIHAMDGEICWVLDLDKPADLIMQGMRKTTRYLIRKARQMNIEIVRGSDKETLKNFLTLYGLTASRHRFIEHKGILEEYEVLKNDNQIELFSGFFEKKLVSMAMIVFYNHQAIYHHSASLEQKAPVSYLLQWRVIEEAIRRAKKLYNFWGVSPEGNNKHPWYGLSLFKRGFGGRELEYLHAYDLPVTQRYWISYAIDSFRKIRKGY